MNTCTIKIETALRDYIQALHYEVESRKSLLVFAMERGLIGTEAFEKYHDEYKEHFIMYKHAKSNLEEVYIKPIIRDDQHVDWELDFYESEIIIKFKKESGSIE